MKGTTFAWEDEEYRHYVPSDQFSSGYKTAACGDSDTYPDGGARGDSGVRGELLWGENALVKPPCPFCTATLEYIVASKESSVRRSENKLAESKKTLSDFNEGVL